MLHVSFSLVSPSSKKSSVSGNKDVTQILLLRLVCVFASSLLINDHLIRAGCFSKEEKKRCDSKCIVVIKRYTAESAPQIAIKLLLLDHCFRS
jgi:hypothetical protein